MSSFIYDKNILFSPCSIKILKVIGSPNILSDLRAEIQNVTVKFVLLIEITFFVLLKLSEEECICL